MIDSQKEPKVSIRITYLLTSHLDRENPVVFRKTYSSNMPIALPRQSKEIVQAQQALSQILTELEADLWEKSNKLSLTQSLTHSLINTKLKK